jgi:NAD(P)-dependent dehydrogenase (short-subunit alcohol dehydrogenase family)
MTNHLDGQSALVTGSTSGIGRATAERLAKQGAFVVITGRNSKRGAEVVDGIVRKGGTAAFVSADLSEVRGVRSLASAAKAAAGGRIDILVNNGGIFPFTPSVDVSPAEFDETYNVNVRAPFFLVQALAPDMAERGHGSIVNLSTFAATKGVAGSAVYTSSKAAVETLTKVWAAEYGSKGVRVNAVAPGPVNTGGTAGMGEGLQAQASASAAGRIGEPEEIAAAVAFLVSAEARLIHGAILPVDGGLANS